MSLIATLTRTAAVLALSATAAHAQTTTLRLWPDGAPGPALPGASAEVTQARGAEQIVRNVTEPSLTVFRPDPKLANGAAVIVAPGGGFHLLSWTSEGTEVARWLNSLGVTAFVLKYRLTPTGDDFQQQLFARLVSPAKMQEMLAPLRPLAAADGEQAVRVVRRDAKTFGVDPHRVGMLGFSAGGAVTVWTLLAGHADSRPDFAVAVYPGLLPQDLTPPAKAPPLFVTAAEDDQVAIGDSKRLAAAWNAAGAKGELLTYPKGGHGFGITKRGAATDDWPQKVAAWMTGLGLLKP